MAMAGITTSELTELLQCANPVFEDLYPRDEYKFHGTSFVAIFNNRYYLITAGHVFLEIPAGTFRVFDQVARMSLPVVLPPHGPKSERDEDDLAIFQIDVHQLNPGAILRLHPIDLARQRTRQLRDLPSESHLVTKGYPASLVQVTQATFTLNNRSFLFDGVYSGRLMPGLYTVKYFDDQPDIDLKGLSGVPWIVAESSSEEWVSLLAGVHIAQGSSQTEESGIFIGADRLIRRLEEIES